MPSNAVALYRYRYGKLRRTHSLSEGVLVPLENGGYLWCRPDRLPDADLTLEAELAFRKRLIEDDRVGGHHQKKQVRLGSRQGPNRRPQRGPRARRNIRTRRAKARSPGSSDDDGSSEGESGPAAHSREPLDLLDAVALSLGWERAA